MQPSNKRITIKDIAKVLDIHHSTVSRALNDHSEIHPDTKRKVLETVEKLNYQPNIFARNLKTNKTNIIGVIVPEIKHSFFASMISGIEEIAQREGFALLLSQSNENYEREVLNIKALVSNGVAGLLVSISQTTHNADHLKLLQKQGIQLVLFDRIIENIDASTVVINDYHDAMIATEYLIQKGYNRIAHIAGTKEMYISKQRLKGYKAALEKHNIKYNEDYVFYGGFQEENGLEGMNFLLDAQVKPDAVFAVNDPVALGAYETIKKHSLKIPEDIAVIGFSDNPISALIDPPLTTIAQPSYNMGKQAAELLFKKIKTKSYINEDIVLESMLIERQST